MDAILFPVDEDQPRLVKVAYTEVESDEYPGIIDHERDMAPWFGQCFKRPFYITQCLGMSGPPLGRTIMIEYNDNSAIDGSKPNRCVQRLLGEEMVHPWRDNLMVFRAREPVSMTSAYDNATMDDLTPAVLYLKEYDKRVRLSSMYFGR